MFLVCDALEFIDSTLTVFSIYPARSPKKMHQCKNLAKS